jgi:hypothetical protein
MLFNIRTDRRCINACVEIYFDGNEYTSAAHCYTLAATASKEADALDLWACAITRHAYVAVYEEQFRTAAPMLELAAALARRGDSRLSTRHWVAAVQAQAFAGIGVLDACREALDVAEQVTQIGSEVHNGGWLRFDGSRLAEERGTCYVQLGRPNLAEAPLIDAQTTNLSARRRGGVLTDLAMIGVHHSDTQEIAMHADAALEIAQETRSGVIARKLHRLQPRLTPFLSDKRVRRIHRQITTLTTTPTTE